MPQTSKKFPNIFIRKKNHILSGSMQFKLMLFKGQLHDTKERVKMTVVYPRQGEQTFH